MSQTINWPPKYVKERNGKYSWRPWIPARKRHLVTTKSGYLSPPIQLGTTRDSKHILLERYQRAQESLYSLINPKSDDDSTLGWLCREYLVSPEFIDLESETQISYEARLKVLMRFPVKIDNVDAKVSNIPVQSLTLPVINKLRKAILLDYRERGFKGQAATDGLIRQLSALLSWGLSEYEDIGLAVNPCMGLRKKKDKQAREEKRKSRRYVEDWEYDAQLEYACAKGFEWLPIFYELAYLLASRSIEVRHLTIDNIKDHGVEVQRRKGSNDNIILWSHRLKRVVNAAIKLRDSRIQKDQSKVHHSSHSYLLTGHNGQITRAALTSATSRLKKAMKMDGLGNLYWTPHDLKRKGISDAEDKQIAGHRTADMIDLYDTKRDTYKPPK